MINDVYQTPYVGDRMTVPENLRNFGRALLEQWVRDGCPNDMGEVCADIIQQCLNIGEDDIKRYALKVQRSFTIELQ